MAKTPKKTAKDDKPVIEDAEILPPETAGDDAEAVPATDAGPEDKKVEAEPTSEAVLISDSEPEQAEDTPSEDAKASDTVDGEGQTSATTDPVIVPTPAPRPEPKRGGFLPLLLGGVIAGGIGYGVAYVTNQDGSAEIAALKQTLSSESNRADQAEDRLTSVEEMLAGKMDASTPVVAPDALNAELQSVLETLRAERGDAVANLDTRLAAVEKRPDADGGADDAAIAAYQRDVEALRALVTEQQNRNDALAQEFERLEANAKSSIAEAADQAAAIKAEAEAAARATATRSALVEVQAALESGVPFEDALARLAEAGGVEVPAALADSAANGVAPLASLQQDVPAKARAALAVSRTSGEGDDTPGRFAAFLQNQLGTRSLEAREGNDPDAVLSRVEDAVRKGDLATALAELEALPEAGRAEMADWEAAAAKRQSALDAAAELADSLNQN